MTAHVELAIGMRSISRLLSTLRDKNTDKVNFTKNADRLMTMICEEGLSHIQHGISTMKVETPTGTLVEGEVIDYSSIVAVSIIRAGDSMLDCFLRIAPETSVGKILIQRDEATAMPILYYSKLPTLAGRQIILLDPMLATGGSAKAAIQTLIDKGASEDKIAFFNVVSCPQGIEAIQAAYPQVKVVTGKVDEGLNEKAYIVPGLGDYGDRYYGTL